MTTLAELDDRELLRHAKAANADLSMVRDAVEVLDPRDRGDGVVLSAAGARQLLAIARRGGCETADEVQLVAELSLHVAALRLEERQR